MAEGQRRLVLKRRLDEEIVIADGEITIKVTQIGTKHVRLCVSAERSIPVRRGELSNADILSGPEQD
jgi:carbon storage regulator CsrA